MGIFTQNFEKPQSFENKKITLINTYKQEITHYFALNKKESEEF